MPTQEFLNVDIPNNKRIEYSLQYIHRVGRNRARQILCDINMDNKITKDLSKEELITLKDEISKYNIEGDLVCTSLISHTTLSSSMVIICVIN